MFHLISITLTPLLKRIWADKKSKCHNQDEKGQIECKTCPIGSFPVEKTACDSCDLGKYSLNGSSCEKCPKGYFRNDYTKNDCDKCPSGTYQPEQGKLHCLDCPVGTFNNHDGRSECIDCPIGKYQELTKQSSCKDCATGTFQTLTKQTSCKDFSECVCGTAETKMVSSTTCACTDNVCKTVPITIRYTGSSEEYSINPTLTHGKHTYSITLSETDNEKQLQVPSNTPMNFKCTGCAHVQGWSDQMTFEIIQNNVTVLTLNYNPSQKGSIMPGQWDETLSFTDVGSCACDHHSNGNLCENGGTPDGLIGSCTCTCPVGYIGDNCEACESVTAKIEIKEGDNDNLDWKIIDDESRDLTPYRRGHGTWYIPLPVNKEINVLFKQVGTNGWAGNEFHVSVNNKEVYTAMQTTISDQNELQLNKFIISPGDATGQWASNVCQAGHYQTNTNDENAPTCAQCQVGQYQDKQNSGWCEHCPSGKYKETMGSSSCDTCPHKPKYSWDNVYEYFDPIWTNDTSLISTSRGNYIEDVNGKWDRYNNVLPNLVKLNPTYNECKEYAIAKGLQPELTDQVSINVSWSTPVPYGCIVHPNGKVYYSVKVANEPLDCNYFVDEGVPTKCVRIFRYQYFGGSDCYSCRAPYANVILSWGSQCIQPSHNVCPANTYSEDYGNTCVQNNNTCDASTVPQNAVDIGDCPNQLTQTESCSPTCSPGYTLSSRAKCDQNGFTAAVCTDDGIDDCKNNPCGAGGTCIDGPDSFSCNCGLGHGMTSDGTCEKCSMFDPPEWNAANDQSPCGNHTKCQGEKKFVYKDDTHEGTCEQCPGGHTSENALGAGGFSTICTPKTCDATAVGNNMVVGACAKRTALLSGSSCNPTCNVGYSLTQSTSCYEGVLTVATCEIQRCNTGPNGTSCGSYGEPSGLYGNCKCVCNSGYTGTHCGTPPADSCFNNRCIKKEKRDSMGIDQNKANDIIEEYAKNVASGGKISIAREKSIKFIENDSIEKQRARLKEVARLPFADASVYEFRFDKESVPTEMFKMKERIREVRVLRPNRRHAVVIEKRNPLYIPMVENEGIILELESLTYMFNQTGENTTQATWPNAETQLMKIGESVVRNHYIFTAGSISVEPEDEGCDIFLNSTRNCTTILNSYTSNGCCGASEGVCEIYVLEYHCKSCCS